MRHWRERLGEAPQLSARAMFAIQRLLTPDADSTAADWESVRYIGSRLAKLGVPLSQITNAIEQFRVAAEIWLRRERTLAGRELLQTLITRCHPLALTVAQAYVEDQSYAREALVSVLDAELNARGLDELLQQLLNRAGQVFPMRWGAVLLADDPGSPLVHRALFGIGPELVSPIGVGRFYTQVARTGVPGFLLDAANDPRVMQPYFRALEVKSVWAAPLGNGGQAAPGHIPVIGVLAIAFDRVYECLPRERALMMALAQRSTLAIERARLVESLTHERERVTDLSRRLLAAQDEERRRISRDLHDDTGQALLALRLYLEMGIRQRPSRGAAEWMKKGLTLLDDTVDGLRRIMAQLSPLVLDELGLEGALRSELHRQRAVNGWRTRFVFDLGGRELPRATQTLVFRLMQEGLSNISRHAAATRVSLEVRVRDQGIAIALQDNGVGMDRAAAPDLRGRHLGLRGMRERLRLANGELALEPPVGGGLRLRIRIPLLPAVAEHPIQQANGHRR